MTESNADGHTFEGYYAETLWQAARWRALEDLGSPLHLTHAAFGKDWRAGTCFFTIQCAHCLAITQTRLDWGVIWDAAEVENAHWTMPLSSLVAQNCIDARAVYEVRWPPLAIHEAATGLALLGLTFPYRKG